MRTVPGDETVMQAMEIGIATQRVKVEEKPSASDFAGPIVVLVDE